MRPGTALLFVLAAWAMSACTIPGKGPDAGPPDPEARALADIPPRRDLDGYRAWIGPAPIEPPPVGFAVRKTDGKWWLVAPSGRLYWASALRHAGCGTDPGQPVTPYRDALLHKWGPGVFASRCARRTLERMYGWGFTALGTRSSGTLWHARVLPFLTEGIRADNLPLPLAAPGLPDPFHGDTVARFSPALPPVAGWQDAPFCLGHPGGTLADWSGLASGVLSLPANAPAKADWLRALKEAYGKVSVLRSAWHIGATSFETAAWPGDAKATDIAKADMTAYRARFADWLYASIKSAIRIADRTHLVFGLRVVPGVTPPEVVDAVVRHSDVVVVEVDSAEEALPAIERLAASLDKPLYVSASLPARVPPAELPAAWRRAMERLAAMPSVVGAEVADYMPNTDGSSFVGWDDAPEALLMDAARATNQALLRIHAGEPSPAR